MRRVQNPVEEHWRIHQLHLCRFLHRPATHQQQRSQSASVELLDLRNVEYQHADALQLLDLAPELVERSTPHHATRKIHDRYVLQALDLELEFHMSIHTNQPGKKFLNLPSLNWTFYAAKRYRRRHAEPVFQGGYGTLTLYR